MRNDAVEKLASADIRSIDAEALVDAKDVKLNMSLPREARAAYLYEKLLNPYCYKVGGIAVKLEFDNDAASLQDNLTDFFVRKKNGL